MQDAPAGKLGQQALAEEQGAFQIGGQMSPQRLGGQRLQQANRRNGAGIVDQETQPPASSDRTGDGLPACRRGHIGHHRLDAPGKLGCQRLQGFRAPPHRQHRHVRARRVC